MKVPDSGLDEKWIRTHYREYLKTEHWRDVKRRYKASKLPQRCFICNSYKNINIHHKTYKRVGREYLRDLLPLCSECHKLVHAQLKVNNRSRTYLWNMAKRVKQRMALERKVAKTGRYQKKSKKRRVGRSRKMTRREKLERKLSPEDRAWITPPSGPDRVIEPVDAETFAGLQKRKEADGSRNDTAAL